MQPRVREPGIKGACAGAPRGGDGGQDYCLVWIVHRLISVLKRLRGVGFFGGGGGASRGTRPVERSVRSGSATRMPTTSRPSTAAQTAARASCSAVAAPADTATTPA